MKKFMIIAVAVSALVAGCRGNGDRARTADTDGMWEETYTDNTHTAENSLDYVGTYTGILPCADCEGIKTELTLTDGGSYEFRAQYMGKGDGTVYINKGAYWWDGDGMVISLQDNNASSAPMMFRVEENALRQLDLNGDRIEGPNAEHYILRK